MKHQDTRNLGQQPLVAQHDAQFAERRIKYRQRLSLNPPPAIQVNLIVRPDDISVVKEIDGHSAPAVRIRPI